MAVEDITTKTCTKCGIQKLVSEYHKRPRNKNGIRPECKSCSAVEKNRYKEENRDRIRISDKKWYERTKEGRKPIKKAYKQKNKDRDRNRTKKYYENNPDKLLARKESIKEWAKNNPDKVSEKSIRWQKKNPEKKKAIVSMWRSLNREWTREYTKRWCRENPHLVRERRKERQAQKEKATPFWADQEEIRRIYLFAIKKREESGGNWHVDHTVPLVSKKVCGLHCHFNLQVMDGIENITKGNRFWPDMWDPE